jgi:lipopolysaccharide transport protein LptA
VKGIGAHRGWLFALLLAAAMPGGATVAADAADDDSGAKADCNPDNEANRPACKAGTLCVCAGGDVEYRRDKVILNDVVLYQGGTPMMVRARRAETASTDTTDSTWILSGGVKSRLAQGQLAADNATVHFQSSNMTAAMFDGKPATFEENESRAGAPNSAGAALGNVRGSANTIEYDNAGGGEVRLRGDVHLFDGCKDIHGDGFVYNLVQKSLKTLEPAAGASRERVRGTFQQKCKPAAASPNPTAPASAGATTPANAPGATPTAPTTLAPPTVPATPAAEATPPKSP